MGLSRPALSLRARALAALTRREHSRTELRRKLLAVLQRAARNANEPMADDSAEVVDALLDTLSADGWLSDSRFIDSRLRTRAPKLGARRLQAELGQHGLAPEGELWAEVQASEPARAQALLQRRFGEAPPSDDKERAKRVRFLLSRGFSSDLALRLTSGRPLER